MDKFTVPSAHPHCIATCVDADALAAFLEAGRNGTLRDDHPWIIAAELVVEAEAVGARVPILFATERPLEFRQWAYVARIDVVEMRRGRWQTACEFRDLSAINPIWSEIDSVLVKPGDDELRRERLEPIRQHRIALDAQRIHPYAICETPAFIMAGASMLEGDGTGAGGEI
jgi:hypothetical protein